MRNKIIAGAFLLFGVLWPLFQERVMSAAPEYVGRWIALACIVLGVVILVLSDPFYAYVFKREQRALAVLVVASASAVIGGSAYWFLVASRPPTLPLHVRMSAVLDAYPAGSVVAGIEWSDKYSTLRVRFDNATDEDFLDLDLLIRPDVPIARIGQMTRVEGVTFVDGAGMDVTAWMGATPRSMASVNVEVLATSDGYRVVADRLKAHSHLEVIAATVTVADRKDVLRVNLVDKAPQRQETAYWYRYTASPLEAVDYFGIPPPLARNALLRGSYSAAGKEHQINDTFDLGGLARSQAVPKQ